MNNHAPSEWARQTIVNNIVASQLIWRLPSSLHFHTDLSSVFFHVYPEVIATRGGGGKAPLTGDQMKHTATLNEITDVFGFESCWKHLGYFLYVCF